MAQTEKTAAINERDRRVIGIVSRLTDKELFGLECFLAGTRAGAHDAEKRAADRQQAAQGAAV